jgi:DNA invertase Pin-like site-specific DNA recombinase
MPKRFDAVLVARFDRFARSTKHLLTALAQFDELKIDFVSLNESIDTSTPMGKMVFTILGAVAELERSLIRERVQAGVDRAKRQGKQLGRPKVVVDREHICAMRVDGASVKAIARDMKLSWATVNSILLKGLKKPSAEANDPC